MWLSPVLSSLQVQLMARKRFPPTMQLAIETLDAEGVGLAQFGEKRARVKGGLPGELVIARTVGKRKGAALTVAEEVTDNTSPERVTVPCDYFPRCGGCALQHMSYGAQLNHKQAGLLAELAANRVPYARLRPAVASPEFGYRRKARLGVRRLHDMQLVGFREAFGGRIVKMDSCMALAPPFDGLLGALAELISQLSMPAMIPQIETAVGDADQALVVRHLEPLTAADARLLGEFEREHGVWVYTQAEGYDSVQPLSDDAPLLAYSLAGFDVQLEFSVTDFVQVNAHINNALVQAVCAALVPSPDKRIGDLFCGIGNFSLPLASSGAQVRGWEAAAAAIERAKHNARRNNLAANTYFEVADLYNLPGDKKQILPIADVTNLDALVLDPPRSGAGPALASWLAPGVSEVAYVSCNPSTFASDAKVLLEHGFALEEVGIYDMFPHTAHVETLGIFRRHG